MHGNPVFDAHPSPTLVVDTEFVIRAANRAYLQLTDRTSEDLIGAGVFEAFPDNPDAPESDGAANLRESLTRVLRTRREHHMAVQRYDVVTADDSGAFVRKFWAPVNSPIFEQDRIIGVLHRVEDVTQLEEDLRSVLSHYHRIAGDVRVTPEEARRFTDSAAAFVAEAQQFRGLADEVLQLRRALSSRATIDQAKGIVMSERHCSADDAYSLLVQMSNETNVRLADVAAALVYQAQGPACRPVQDRATGTVASTRPVSRPRRNAS
ncbi:MAG TPA: ANTAR domain-containing protein [Nocardioidaceae bacterium]|nr:ANTAR domain-containing protein [Nocardioidaceae bacterium]